MINNKCNEINDFDNFDNFDEFTQYYLNLGSDDGSDNGSNNGSDDGSDNGSNDGSNNGLCKNNIVDKNKTIYENKELYSKSGELIGFIPERRYNWYIKKNLCDVIDSHSIKLKFEPNYKNQKVVIDREKQSAKQNICVVCGCTENLKRFRVIPYEIKKHFPEKYKAHISSDVVILCQKLSSDGDYYNKELKLILFREYDVDINNFKIESKKRNMYITLKKIENNNFNCVNPYTKKSLNNYFGKDPTKEDMQNLINEVEKFNYMGFETPEEMLIFNVIKSDKMEDFIKRWKTNFYDMMEPKYLQWDYWN